MKVTWGEPTRHAKTSEIGARVFVSLSHGGWDAHLHLDTHGLSSAQVADRLADLEAAHQRLAAVLDRLQELHGLDVEFEGITYRIFDATIPPRSQRAHDLVIGIRRVDGEQFAKVQGWPLRLRLASIDDCPTNEEIIAIVRARLGQQTSVQTAHEAFVAKVTAKLA